MNSAGPFCTAVLCAAILLFALFQVIPAKAGAGPFTPEQVKAAMLIKFTDFITWPENAFKKNPGAFVIAVMGNPEIFRQLSELSGSSVQGRTLSVTRMPELDLSRPVHLLYADPSRVPELKEVFVREDSLPLLTVSDSEAFLEAGGMLSFLPMEKGRIGFAVNRAVQIRSGLTFSSALLRLAEIRDYGEGQPE